MSPGGRRPGNSGSREAILDAARAQFAQAGYEAASIRGIAREAGVDPALVHHFFGSKEQVFIAATELPVDPGLVVPELLAAGADRVGERVARLFLGLWDDPVSRRPVMALVRSAVSTDRGAAVLREFITTAIVGRIAAALDQPDPQLRATLCGSQLVGLAMVRYVLCVEPLASTDTEVVIAAVAPTLQRYLTGDLGVLGQEVGGT